MTKYDDASWHYGGDYPKSLPKENAATHIGIFLVWCIHNDLVSEKLLKEAETEIIKIKNREITGTELLLQLCDEKLTEYDLNKVGNAFAKDYYEDDTDFANSHSSYLDDYADTFFNKAEENGLELETIYHIENTFANYDIIKAVMDSRFEKWKAYSMFK